MFSILYVDDEPGLLEIGKLFLESAGDFSVTTVLSGKQAIDKLGQQDFDAIISDYQMPEMNGIEFLKHVRKSFGTSPFILFTGRGREEVVIEAINNGVDFYLQKGGEPQAQFAELAHKVRQAISRKRAETALSDSERRLADIINFLPDATFAIDTKGTVIAWNRAMERMTGVASSHILGKGDYAYAVPFYHERRPLLINLVLENDPAIAEKYPFVKNEGGNLVSEITIPHFNEGRGAALWFTASPLYDRKGEIVGAIESIREITERKKAEEALNESERRFRELADLLPQGIYEASTDGRMTYVNRIALEMSGYAAEDVKTGLNSLEVIAPKDRPRAVALFTRMVKTGARGEGSAEYLAVRKDGSLFPVSIYSSPIYRDGRITGIRGVIIDITEQKKAEERLVSANREYTNLLDQIQDIYYFSDMDGRLVRASRSIATLLGYDDISECIGKNIAEDFYANPQERNRLIDELMRNGKVTGFETLLRKKDGNTVLIEASSHLSYDQDGNVIGVEGTFRDITERKRAEEELRAANEQLQASEEELREQYDELAASEQRIRESEERYRTVFETTGTAMLIIEEDATISLANAEFSRMSGFSREEIENKKKWMEFVFGEDREGMLAQHQKRRTDPQNALHRYEFRFLARSGGIRYIDLTIDIIPGTKKSIASLLDITERRKAEEELRAANEQLQASEEELRQQYDELARAEDALRFLKISVDQSADEVFWLDFNGKILYVNDAACRINGYPRDEFLNMTIFDMNPDLTPEIWAGSVANLREKKTQLFTTRHMRKEGGIADVEIMSVYVRKGDEEYSFAFVRDITARKRAEGELKAAYEQVTAAEEELRQQYDTLAAAEAEISSRRRQLEEIAATVPGVVYQFYARPDGSKGMYFASSRAREILGLEPDLERFFPEFTSRVHPDDRARFIASIDDAIKKKSDWHFEGRLIKGSGETIWFEGRSTPVAHGSELVYSGVLLDITGRRNMEAAIRESEEKYRSLVDLAPVAVIVHRDGKVLYANPEALRLAGAEREDDVVGRELISFIHADDREMAGEDFRRLYENGETIPLKEERLVRIDGEPFTVEITAMPIRYHGTPSVLAVFQDITKRKQAEAALAESERKYRTVFETAEEGIWIIDAGFRTVSANRKMQELFGYTEEEMRGRPVWDFVPPDEAESVRQELSKRTYGVPGRYERRWVRKDGTEIWCLTSGTPLFSPDGEFLGSFGMFTDTTERKQMEDALRESEKKYRSLVENIPFGITLMDADHRIVMSNAAQGQMFHTDAGVWPGRYCYQEFEKRDAVCAHCPGTKAMATGVCHVVETEGVRDDGTRFNARIHAIPLPDAEGKATRFIEVVEDITERKKAEDALRQNEEKYRTLIETTGTGFVIIDEDGRVLDANPEYVRLTGHSRLEEIAGRSVIEWTAEHKLERNAEAVRQCLRDGFIRNFEIDYTARDGTVLPIEINATVLRSKGSLQILTLCRDISDRRRAQDTLKTSAEDYQTILRTAMDGFCIIALDGSFIDVNDAFCRSLEYTRDEALALSLCDVEVRETAEETTRHIENIVRNGYDRFETRWQQKGGGIIDVEVSVLYTGTHGGRFITFSRNITEQKRAEAALRESEEKYRTLVESSFDGIAIHQGGILVYVNRTAAQLLGSDDPGVFIGKPALDLVAPAFREQIAERMQKSTETAMELIHEQFLRLDGTPIDVDVTTTPTTWQGRPAAYVTFRDISVQKKTEEALRESEEKYRMLVEKSRDGVFIIQDGRLVFYNRALAGLTGYTAEDLDGKILSDLIAPEDREMVVSRARDRAAGRHVPELYEFSLLHKDGISRTRVRVRAGPGTYKGRPASIGMFYDVTLERKREEALRESEAKFRELTELLPQIVFEMDRNLVITFVNQQAYTALGYSPEDVAAGFNALSIIDPSQHARVRHNIGKLVKKEPYEHTEYTIFRKDGTSFPALIYADTMLKNGEVTGFRGIIIDISVRKQAEDALRASEEKYRTLVEVNRDIIYSLDSGGTILYVSPQTINQLGYRPDEMVGHDFKEFIHPDDIQSMVLHIQESISAGKPAISDQFRVRRKDGSYRWFEDNTIYTTDSQGRHIVAGTIRDITEEKAAQDALRESEEKFRALVETTSDFIWEVDASGVYTYVSPQVRQILGYEPEELLGKTPFDIMPPDEGERVAAAFNGCVTSRLPIVALENKAKTKDGSVVILETSGVVRNAKDGSFLGYRGIDRDITKRKLAEEALLEKTEELNRFFTTSLDLFCIADTGGYFRRLNHEWEKSLGYTLAELEGHRFIDFVHPDDLEPTLAAIADLGKQQEVLNFTNRYRHKNGTYRWIEWRSLPVGDYIFAAARDITARHDAAERIARLSALKQDLLRTAPLEEKLKRITDAVVDIFGADFARIWITGPGDLCKKGCIHAEVSEGARLCRNRANCLHLIVSSGRYTHTDGSHRRVPFGAYKIGRIATGDIKQFITNDVTNDPRVHDHAWAKSLGLVSFSGFRLVSPDGNPIGVLAFFGRKPVIPEVRDDLDDLATTTSQVVQMDRAEQALRESEARLSSILHGSPVLQFVIDRNHRVISWNNALEEYSGIKAADIIGTDEQWRAFYPAKRPVLADLLVNGNTDAITRLYAGKLRKSRYVEEAYEATDFFPHMGSSGIWLSFTAAPIRDEQGTIIGAIETLEDVTERMNAEEALRESEKWTRTILNTAQAGIILVDAVTHQIVDANKKALELIGLDREKVISAICHRFICPAEKEKCPVTDLGQKVNTSERVLLTAAGVQVPVLKTVVPAFIGGRDVLVESFVDISEQKQAEAAIRETNRKLNLLNSITRHDIRNQLLVAQGYTQLAILNKPDPVVTDFLAKTAAVIETIQRQIEFTREYQEMGVQAPAWFAVGTVISSVRPGTVALRNTCNTAVEIFADPMIDKVFYNLFDNAIKHGTHVTAVTARCEEKENGLFITFADNGSGIPLDEKQKIFEKGYGKNTGLGLFLVREILAITGIAIHETGTPGLGAVFEIIVPAGAYRKTG